MFKTFIRSSESEHREDLIKKIKRNKNKIKER